MLAQVGASHGLRRWGSGYRLGGWWVPNGARPSGVLGVRGGQSSYRRSVSLRALGVVSVLAFLAGAAAGRLDLESQAPVQPRPEVVAPVAAPPWVGVGLGGSLPVRVSQSAALAVSGSGGSSRAVWSASAWGGSSRSSSAPSSTGSGTRFLSTGFHDLTSSGCQLDPGQDWGSYPQPASGRSCDPAADPQILAELGRIRVGVVFGAGLMVIGIYMLVALVWRARSDA
jgi:hypothetical protein